MGYVSFRINCFFFDNLLGEFCNDNSKYCWLY